MLKKLKLSDYLIIGVCLVLLALGAFIMLRHKKVSGLPETQDTKIYFQVMMRGVSLTDTVLPFKNDEETFITIRNVPYTKLKIVNVAYDRRKTIISSNNSQGYLVAEDVSLPYMYDFLVTLEDTAKKTDDGFVLGGNKLKIGIPIILEGERYKLNGIVSNIKTEVEVREIQKQAQSQDKQ